MTENRFHLIRSDAAGPDPVGAQERALQRPVDAPASGSSCAGERNSLRCALCQNRSDVVLCSFAFEHVHRRVPLCAEHRAPLAHIDEQTRSGAPRGPSTFEGIGRRSAGQNNGEDRHRFRNATRTRPAPSGPEGATVTVLKDRRR